MMPNKTNLEPALNNPETIVISANVNVGFGLWTWLCVIACFFIGRESRNLLAKQNYVSSMLKKRIQKQAEEHPGYHIYDVKVAYDGCLSATAVSLLVKDKK